MGQTIEKRYRNHFIGLGNAAAAEAEVVAETSVPTEAAAASSFPSPAPAPAQATAPVANVFSPAVTNRLLLSQAQACLTAGRPESALKILDGMTFFGNFDPNLLKAQVMKAVARHQQGDFSGALGEMETAKLNQPQARAAEQRYRGELRRLAGEMETAGDEAARTGDLLKQGEALEAALPMYRALEDETKIAALESRLEAMREPLAAARRTHDIASLKARAQEWTAQGLLTEAAIARYEKHVPDGVKLSPYLKIAVSADGSPVLHFTEEFERALPGLNVEDIQLKILNALEPVIMEGSIRRLAETASDPAKRSYYAAKVDLLEGRLESARLHFLEVASHPEGADGELTAMRREARAFLKAATRSHLGQLKDQNEILKAQRLNHLINKEEGFWVDRDGIEAAAAANARLVQALEIQIEAGAATLDEALAGLQEEAALLPGGESAKLAAAYQNLSASDADFHALLHLETKASLENRRTAVGKRAAFLETAATLRHANGSYEIAGKFLEGALGDEFEAAIADMADEESAIRNDATRGFESVSLKKKIRESHERLKSEDPLAFFARYGEGPSAEQFDAECEQAREHFIRKALMQKACARLEARYQSGELDETSRRSWEMYVEMTDPFHELGNFSDQGRDALIDEAVITAVTLPLTLGAGSALRGAMSGSRLAARIATSGRLGRLAVDAAIFTAGSAAEALTQELLTMPFAGSFHAENIGYNFAMSVGFHAGNKLWAREAANMGIDAASRRAVRSFWVRTAMAVADGAGMLGTQTTLATGLSYAHDADPSQDISERIGASALRMLGAHGMTKAISALPRNPVRYEQNAASKLKALTQAVPEVIETTSQEIVLTETDIIPVPEEIILTEADLISLEDADTVGGSRPVEDGEILPAARRVWAGEDPRQVYQEQAVSSEPSQRPVRREIETIDREVLALDSFLLAEAGILAHSYPTDSFRPYVTHYRWPNLDLHVRGAVRAEKLIAALSKKYGDRLQTIDQGPAEANLNIVDERGTPLIRIAMKITPQTVSTAEARKFYRQFHQEDYLILKKNAARTSERGTYARKILALVSGEYKFFAQKSHTPAERERLATMTDYLKEARFLVKEMEIVHRAEEALESRDRQSDHGEIARLKRELKALSEDVRHSIPVDDLLDGRIAPEQRGLRDRYEKTLGALDRLTAREEVAQPGRVRRTGTRGAAAQPSRDLRAFSEAELRQFQDFNLPGLGALADPLHRAYRFALVESLRTLVKEAAGPDALREAVTIRIVGALRQTIDLFPTNEAHRAKMKDILGRALGTVGRAPGGNSMPQATAVELSPAEQNFLHAAFRDRGLATPQAITADNFREILIAVSQFSAKGSRHGRHQKLKPSPTGRHILGKVVQGFGETLRGLDPEYHRQLVELTGGAHRIETKEAPGARRSSEPMAKMKGHIHADASVVALLKTDLASLDGTRPSLVGEIPGLTLELERKFEVGGSVGLLDGRMMRTELPSGAHTQFSYPTTPEEHLIYRRWFDRQWGALPQRLAARPALESLLARAADAGIDIKFGEERRPMRLWNEAKIQEVLETHGPALAYLNEIMAQLPKSIMQNSPLKTIHLNSARVGAGHFGTFVKGTAYIYSGAMQGSRRNLAALFLHELGHAAEQRYTEPTDRRIPQYVLDNMEDCHGVLVERWAQLGLDVVGGPKQRFEYQNQYEEFLAETYMMYVAAGAKLRAHIESFPEGSPARAAWDYVYRELKLRIFGGREFGAVAAKAPDWRRHEVDWGDIAAAADLGAVAKAGNEDRFLVVRQPGGTVLVAIDGMGGHAGGERAAEIVRATMERALLEGKFTEEALALAHQAVYEDSRAQGFVVTKPSGEETLRREAPGAVAIAVEILKRPDGSQWARFQQIGDADAIVIRPSENRILHHTTRPTAMAQMQRSAQGLPPYQLTHDGRLARGQTLMLRIDPSTNVVDGALGILQHEVYSSSLAEPLKPGDIVIAGSDGLFEEFGTLDTMLGIVTASGARRAADVREVLREEALIRQVLAKKYNGKELDHAAYLDAYREATGREAPEGWRGMYEPFQDEQGQWHRYSVWNGNVFHEGSEQIVDHFKRDNLNIVVQVIQ